MALLWTVTTKDRVNTVCTWTGMILQGNVGGLGSVSLNRSGRSQNPLSQNSLIPPTLLPRSPPQ